MVVKSVCEDAAVAAGVDLCHDRFSLSAFAVTTTDSTV